MKRFLLLLITVFSCNILFAQSYITGKITNSKGETIPFANIIIDKTTEGVSADENGNYQLKTFKVGDLKLINSFINWIYCCKQINYHHKKQ